MIHSSQVVAAILVMAPVPLWAAAEEPASRSEPDVNSLPAPMPLETAAEGEPHRGAESTAAPLRSLDDGAAVDNASARAVAGSTESPAASPRVLDLDGSEKIESYAPDDSISRFRTTLEVLTDRTIGSASKPVKFDWRRSTVQVASTGSRIAELNNYESIRAGGLLRVPALGMIFELGLTHVWVWDTESSRRLARTPYRQPARPKRYELDFALGVPLAEGVVTAWPGFFPATELVFNAYADLRYSIYPAGFSGLGFRKSALAVFSPSLTKEEKKNLDDERLPAMQVDSGRFGLMVGVGTDIYFQSGLFFSPRVFLAVPLVASATKTELPYWFDVSLALGLAI